MSWSTPGLVCLLFGYTWEFNCICTFNYIETEFQLNQNLDLFAIYVVNSQQSQLNEHDKDARHKSAYPKRKGTRREVHQRRKKVLDLHGSWECHRLSVLSSIFFHLFSLRVVLPLKRSISTQQLEVSTLREFRNHHRVIAFRGVFWGYVMTSDWFNSDDN